MAIMFIWYMCPEFDFSDKAVRMLTLTFWDVQSFTPAHEYTEQPVCKTTVMGWCGLSSRSSCSDLVDIYSRYALLTLHIYSAISRTIFTVIIWPGGILQLFIWKVLVLMCPMYLPQILAGSQRWSPAVCWSTQSLDESLFGDSPLHTIIVQGSYLHTWSPCVCATSPESQFSPLVSN